MTLLISSPDGLEDVGPDPDSVGIFPAVLPKLRSDVKGHLTIQISLVFMEGRGKIRHSRKGSFTLQGGGNYIIGSFL